MSERFFLFLYYLILLYLLEKPINSFHLYNTFKLINAFKNQGLSIKITLIDVWKYDSLFAIDWPSS